MAVVRNILFILSLIFSAAFFLGWLGIYIRPKPFPPFPEETPLLRTTPLPNELPGPVERFYRTVYGNELPAIKAAVILGCGIIKSFLNIPIPVRFVFVHNAAKDYRLYYEGTIFGVPFLKVNEGYINGTTFINRPEARIANNVSGKQISSFGVWAEAIWIPAIWETYPCARWKPVDADTAILCLPSENLEDNYLIHFDSSTGLIDAMESTCYSENGKEQIKLRRNPQNEFPRLSSRKSLDPESSVLCLDQGSPWVYINAEKIIFNVDVDIYIRQSGY
jgi:hypothetical protein